MMHAQNRRAVARTRVGLAPGTRRQAERASGPRNAKHGQLCQRVTRLDVLPWRGSLRDLPAADVPRRAAPVARGCQNPADMPRDMLGSSRVSR